MLTAKQSQTYQFICDYVLRHGIAPTESEIADGIGIKSRGVVHRYISALREKGLIDVVPNRRRNIRLSDKECGFNFTDIPILGKIAAGHPIEALENRYTINLADQILGHNRFLLQVLGDSMIGDNICDGDLIICESCKEANTNSIVVALIDGQEATLKRYQLNEDSTITLVPSNPELLPQVYEAKRIQIQGRYIGLLRFNEKKAI